MDVGEMPCYLPQSSHLPQSPALPAVSSNLTLNLLSWNCRGTGGSLYSSRMRHLSNLISFTKAKVIFVSEVKSNKYSPDEIIQAFPVHNIFTVPAEGISGGLWLLWTNDVDIVVVSSSRNFILANISISQVNFKFRLVCIYGDPYHECTNDIWAEVLSFVNVDNSPLFCMGDLNELLNANEKISATAPNTNRISSFRNIISNCGLIDLGYNGPAYTWTNRRFSSNPTFQRLDRCLANVAWCSIFPNTNVYHLPLIYGDHAPILAIPCSNNIRKKKDFKFENWWLFEKDFQEVSKKFWSKFDYLPFHKRIRQLGYNLSKWFRKSKLSLNDQLKHIENNIANLQALPPNFQNHMLEDALCREHANISNKLTEYYRQRCKKRWVAKGDRNTSFFHNSVIKRRRKNRISAITNANGQTVTKCEDIAKCFIDYFAELFSSSLQGNDEVQREVFTREIQEDAINTVPTKEEIFNILKSMRGNAAPGPDGFNVTFFRAAWNWIGDDVYNLVRSFYANKYMPESLKKTNIVLIPKKSMCSLPLDFRPISLCNVVYKIIAKSFALKMQPYLPDYIVNSQYAFVKGRTISENIVIAHEIIHSFQQKRMDWNAFMLKLDLAKAFDRIEWRFIKAAMRRLGFNENFIKLVAACFEWPVFSIIINGQSFGRIKSTRGIRQGCPLSPYLFIIAINELTCRLQDAISTNRISGVKLAPSTPAVHSLLFADDVIICGQARREEALVIKDILQSFCRESGQMPNWSKSSILFSKNTPSELKDNIKDIFQVTEMNHNSTHLGHPLFTAHIPKTKVYAFLKNKFKSKFNDWKAGIISHAGRSTLIKSVFSSIPVYYMSHVLFPKSFNEELTTIIRHFWWKGTNPKNSKKPLCLTQWRKFCIPKGTGGLGFRNLSTLNVALITGLAWRMLTNPDALWVKVLKGKYFPNSSYWTALSTGSKSWSWESILKVRNILKSAVQWQLFDGNISIWNQPWCSGWENIHEHIRLEALDSRLPVKVADLWLAQPKRWNQTLLYSIFTADFVNKILQVPISQVNGDDILIWKPNRKGIWTAQSAYKLLQYENIQKTVSKINLSTHSMSLINQIWKNKKILPRVQMFIWRLLTRNLATGQRVHRRMNHISSNCSRCSSMENDEHIFFHCSFVRAIWFASPYAIKTDMLSGSCSDMIYAIFNSLPCMEDKDLVCYILWNIWKARNIHRFQKKESSVHSIIFQARASQKAQYEAFDIEQISGEGPSDLPNHFHNESSYFPGHKCCCRVDASFHQGQESGLGVYITCHENQELWSLQIQAKTSQADTPLHAESLSLVLASQILNMLQVQECDILSDCKALICFLKESNEEIPASGARKRGWELDTVLGCGDKRPTDRHVHMSPQAADWRIRQGVKDVQNNFKNMNVSFHYIPREENYIADILARSALSKNNINSPFSCSNSSHFGFCHVKDLMCNWPSWAKLCKLSCI